MCEYKGLKAGAGIGKILLPQDYFEIVQPDGSVIYEDGFKGTVHKFQGAKLTISDDPCIRILLLEDGVRAALVSMENAQSPADQVAYTKAIISGICGVQEDHIWVHTTHQFGFMHRPADGVKAACYDAAMKKAVTEAARQAMESFRPARLGIGTGLCHVSANRNIPTPEGVTGGPYHGLGSTLDTNKTMTIIRFEALDGEAIGFYMSYGTKPSALCTTGKTVGNRELNSEVPGVACKLMEEEFGAPCMFCMPAAADQYPRETAQFFDFDEDGVWKRIDIGFEKGIEIVDRLGCEMGRDAVSIAKTIECGTAEAKIAAAATGFTYPNKTNDGLIDVAAQALVLGDIAFVGFKQEMDCATERQIQAASPYGTTLLVSFLNGDGKYFAHLEAYDYNNGAGTCEVSKSPFAKGAAEKFVEVITGVLDDLKSGRIIDSAVAGKAALAASRDYDELDFGGHKWLVLDRAEGRQLILSKNILEQRAYHRAAEDVTWEHCDLRNYLNGEWLENNFSANELASIVPVNVQNSSNPKYGIRGGNDTYDKVFLLSLQEAEKYLSGSESLLKISCESTVESVWWHLRSPGEAAYVAASVTAGGLIDYHGTAEGVHDATGGVRPALWVTAE